MESVNSKKLGIISLKIILCIFNFKIVKEYLSGKEHILELCEKGSHRISQRQRK